MTASSKTEDVEMDNAVTESSNNTSNKPVAIKKDKKKKKKKSKKKKNKKTPQGYKRIQKELRGLLLDPPDGVAAFPKTKDNLLVWIATIDGPENTPYEGGKFYLRVKFDEKYPFEPPKVTFKTKIYHCNIKSCSGEICLDVLKDAYSPALTVEKILLSIHQLLQEPNPDDPLVADIAQVLVLDKEKHDQEARAWTRRYAIPQKQQEQQLNDEN